MGRELNQIMEALPEERRIAIEQQAEVLMEEMGLSDLRKAQELSQKTLGEILDINQASVSKMEHRTDMYLSTLRHFIQAMGGNLKIIAKFPDHEPIEINQFNHDQIRQA